MKRTSFTGPFWYMMVLGIFASLTAISILKAFSSLPQGSPATLHVTLFYKLKSFLLPVIMFLEASMYWRVRKRNSYRKASWVHVLLFTFAYLTPFIAQALFVYGEFTPASNISRFARIIFIMQLCLFWGVMIIAHIIFGRLLIKIFSKKFPVDEGVSGQENILDDVLM